MVAETCTCGTHLVEDASFCHRCGKAQREFLTETLEEPAAVPLIAIPPPPPAIQPVSFSNSAAVRVGFLAASAAAMLDALPWLNVLFLLWSVLAGFFSVVMYRRRTGQSLTMRNGARMGWITGILNSVIVTVFFTLSFAATSTEFAATYHQQLAVVKLKDPTKYAAVAAFVESPYAIALGIVMLLATMFVAFTLASVAGGALSARMAGKDGAPGIVQTPDRQSPPN